MKTRPMPLGQDVKAHDHEGIETIADNGSRANATCIYGDDGEKRAQGAQG